MAITNSTGTFVPYNLGAMASGDRSGVEDHKGHPVYKIDLRHRNVNELEYIKWCRRNLGNRGESWDFWLAGGILYIEIWGDKARFTYELWKV